MRILIINNAVGNTTQYAQKEFKLFLSMYTNFIINGTDDADRYFVLDVCGVDDDLQQHSYKIQGGTYNNKPAVYIYGASESSLLTGVYEALGKMGIFFDVNGQVIKNQIYIKALDNIDEVFTPFCRNRGIRQHINFPMDISAYHIEQAKEYIRNLARMRMNSITFHSYTGQWHGYKTEEKEVLAGNFFYGQRHNIPEYRNISSVVSNKNFFCIPEVENVLHDNKARSEFAVHWLNEVMHVAKEAGMNVMMSIEFPHGETQDTLVNITRNVLNMYPCIDAIEWISPEGGGEGEQFSYEDITQKAVTMFGEAVLTDGKLPFMPDSLPASLAGAMSSLKNAVDLYKFKDKIFDGIVEKPIHIGLYVMCKDTLKILKNIMDRVLPEEVIYTFLPAHGSKAVADNIEFMDFSHKNWQSTLIYSWIEFDGNMYLQQNSCDGIQQLMETAKANLQATSIYGMCLNHWRTAENTFTIAYSAETMIKPTKASEFYKYYAEVYGIGDVDALSETMVKLGNIDTFNRDNLFNIGFCYLGCWLGKKGLGWIRGWSVESMNYSIDQYKDLITQLYKCLKATSSQKGIMWIRFLINRIECSILQIQAVKKLREISEFVDDNNPQNLSQLEKDNVVKYCDEAMHLSKCYIDKHMEMVADRGCEGTAISYYVTIPTYIDHIKQYFAYGETECKHNHDTFDQPPPPDAAYL